MMSGATLLNREWKVKLLLLISSAGIYFFYFHAIFLNINSVLSSITSDTLKNYYTYIYHIKHDGSALHFGGMGFPYGEHVVYTDCQPILTFILRALPFTHTHLIGILHGLIFLSFIVCPLILYSLFRLFGLNRSFSFCSALAITLLSPQYLKINAGHHGLTYACVIPLSMLLSLRFKRNPGWRQSLYLFAYHLFLFLLHPYLGFSVSVFSFLFLLCMQLLQVKTEAFFKSVLRQAAACLSPVLVFKFFMVLTDHHPGRTTEPYGLDVMVENIDSLVAPVFGPFRTLMERVFNNRPGHYEGHSYLGAFSLLMSVCFLISLPFTLRKLKLNREAISFLISGLLLLLISFGLHNKVLQWLGLELEFMNQFRAVCRFAWFFYYALPVFLIVWLYEMMQLPTLQKKAALAMKALPVLFLALNLWEANAMFRMDEGVFWKFRNIFNAKLLNTEETAVIDKLSKTPVQAIVPLPVFFSGSEMYDRTGFNSSMIPSMLYSSHTGLPIFSVMMSRSSIPETENEINLLNSYKKQRPAAEKLSALPFLLIKTSEELLPDEERLYRGVMPFVKNDSLEYAIVDKTRFLEKKVGMAPLFLPAGSTYYADTNSVIYIGSEPHTPFTIAGMKDISVIHRLDSNVLRSGRYVISFRYYYTPRNFRSLACNLIVTEGGGKDFYWKYDVPVRFLSGFYPGFAVFEYPVFISREKRYEFFISGRSDERYHISDFMIRPIEKTVGLVTAKDSAYNNFPD